jgi:hypothetical protein
MATVHVATNLGKHAYDVVFLPLSHLGQILIYFFHPLANISVPGQ